MENATPQPIRSLNNRDDNPTFAGMVHLGALLLAIATSWIAGVGGAVVGIAVWVLIKDKNSLVARHAAEVFNFNLSLFLYAVAAFMAVVLTLGLGLIIVIPLALVFALIWLVFSIMGAVAGFKGRGFRYPLSIRFIR